MKTILLLLLSAATLHADELIKRAQSELKELGFYYGEATGLNSPETAAAIKRFQIRNGQEVTGTLTKETLQSLTLGAEPTTPAPPKSNPPVNLKRDDPVQESDRAFLQKQPAPSTVAPPVPLTPPAAPGTENYSHIFARTPYEVAPAEVQVATLRRAQNLLAKSGLYQGGVDGVPGTATEEAIMAYQRRTQLPLTGRLDLETLNAMALLPGRSYGPPMRPFTVPPGRRPVQRPLRGVWVR